MSVSGDPSPEDYEEGAIQNETSPPAGRTGATISRGFLAACEAVEYYAPTRRRSSHSSRCDRSLRTGLHRPWPLAQAFIAQIVRWDRADGILRHTRTDGFSWWKCQSFDRLVVVFGGRQRGTLSG